MSELCEHLFFEELDSTNDYVKRLAENHDIRSWTLLQTAYQTNGRGQREHSWESAKNKNLLFSLYIEPDVQVQHQFYLSKITAVALQETIEHELQRPVFIKWPNDIYVENKKIAGILIENTLRQSTVVASIIGVGINVNQTEFPENLPNPVSMQQILNQEVDMEVLRLRFCRIFSQWWKTLSMHQFKAIDEAYHRRLYFRERQVIVNDDIVSFRATLTAVDESGTLLLRNGKNEYRYRFGEVEIDY